MLHKKKETGDYMTPLKIRKEQNSDVTLINNLFIDQYMKDANDAQLKIYLYLLRMLNSNQHISISTIADVFNHTEKDVVRALKYWEKQSLLEIEYDQQKMIVGLNLLDLSKNSSSHLLAVTKTPVEPLDVSTPKEVPVIEKPNYSPEDISAYKSGNEEFAQIIFITEQYLKKMLTMKELQTILFIYDTLGFSADLIDYLVEYCVGKNKKEIRYIETVALNWATENITTVRQAKLRSNKYDKAVYAIMKSLGRSSDPTDKEVSFIRNWLYQYNFSLEIIQLACEKTVLATDKHRFEYTEGILSKWKQQNLRTKSDITQAEARYQSEKSASSPKPNNNKFNDFKQNAYDFERLEKELISN